MREGGHSVNVESQSQQVSYSNDARKDRSACLCCGVAVTMTRYMILSVVILLALYWTIVCTYLLTVTLGTSSIISGWPDAIKCTTYDETTKYVLYHGSQQGSYHYYVWTEDDGSYYTDSWYIQFYQNGSYYADSFTGYLDCTYKSITELYDEGVAFDLVSQ